MSSILDDIASGAEWVAAALRSSGYRADFGPASLKEIDRFFDEQVSAGRAVPGGLLSTDLGPRLWSLGAYVGEVIRRALGGTWAGEDDDPTAELDVTLTLPNQTVMWPMQRVTKRFVHGPSEGIAVYGVALGLDLSAPTISLRSRFLRRRG